MRKGLPLFLFFLTLFFSSEAQQLLHKAVPDGKVDSVWRGHNLPHPYSGKDVIIGFTDWGFDYTNPVFYDTIMDRYRVLRAWDQYRKNGPAPSGYTYGTELVGKDALLLAGSDTSNVYGYNYHGNHVASIAAGAGAGTRYRGVAFDADLLFVSILVDEQAIIDAFHWMYEVSLEEQKRLVINMSWGLYYMGNMDGTGKIAGVIDSLTNLGVVFVSSAGNNGDVDFHLSHNFEEDTLRTLIGYATGSDMQWGQSVSMLNTPGSPFSFAVQLFNATGQLLVSSPFFNTDQGDLTMDTFMLMSPVDTFFYKVFIEHENSFNYCPQARLIVKKLPLTGYNVALIVSAEAGEFHAWNLIELTNDVGNWGGKFFVPSDSSGWKKGDPNYGISTPANIQSVITVAAHESKVISPSGIPVGGNIAYFSSYGTTVDHRTKPEISAPGYGIIAAISSFSNQFAGMIAQTIFFEGRNYSFVSLSGTSMSSPYIAGVAAMVLQANPGLSSVQVKQILLSTTYQDTYTEQQGPERFGFGKVDAFAAVKRALETTDVPFFKSEKLQVTIYPNPATDFVYFSMAGAGVHAMLELFDINGKLLSKQQISESVHKLDIQHLIPGYYLIRITDEKNQVVRKLIKN